MPTTDTLVSLLIGFAFIVLSLFTWWVRKVFLGLINMIENYEKNRKKNDKDHEIIFSGLVVHWEETTGKSEKDFRRAIKARESLKLGD